MGENAGKEKIGSGWKEGRVFVGEGEVKEEVHMLVEPEKETAVQDVGGTPEARTQKEQLQKRELHRALNLGRRVMSILNEPSIPTTCPSRPCFQRKL